jgi:hypothetical protein
METVENKPLAQFMMPPTLNRQVDEVDLTLANGNVDVLLDFAHCTFITVDGLEWLEELLLRAVSLNAKVSLKNIKPTIYKVFKVARIDSVLKACGSPAPSGPVC